MDLSKRLANLDRLSRKNKAPTAARPVMTAETREDALAHLQLKCSSVSDRQVWTREYQDEVASTWKDLPPLHGFFTRAGQANPKLEEILFLDTETTGLSGGTGTIAFLVGVGWITGSTFHSRQYFLPDFIHEEAMLAELSILAREFSVVMTFNGASFDLPLLRTRALMNRLKDPCGALVSWDLLVPGRRLWGRIFPNCRQQTLEKGLLDVRRSSGDIDGALIPQTWFDFLKTGDPVMMERVLHHNQRDLMGMVGIFAKVLDKAQGLQDNDPAEGSWQESWALGRIAELARIQGCAANWMLKAAEAHHPENDNGFVQNRFVADAIRLLKRQQQTLQVEMIITKALDAGLDEPWLHREAAILYEHRMLNLEQALIHAHQSKEPARVQRLENKIRKIQEV